MSFNKKALARYMVYDRCFRDENKHYTIPDLMEQCNLALRRLYHSPGVSRRQVYYDIEFMKSSEGFSAPIAAAKTGDGRKYYYYTDKTYSLFSFLSGEEQVQLSEFIYLLTIIRLLSDTDFVERLIKERGYKYPDLLKSVKKLAEVGGLWSDYHHLKKMYVLLDGIIQNKKLKIRHDNKIYKLIPESVNLEIQSTRVVFYSADSDVEKKAFPLEEIEIA